MDLSDATAFESTARGTVGEGAEAGEPTIRWAEGPFTTGRRLRPHGPGC